MAPLGENIIQHFTHPNHLLFEINYDVQYQCDGCKTLGIGTRFRCHGCDFDLHEYCGTCPKTLSSFTHPLHQLNLVLRQPQAMRQSVCICDVCGDYVDGLSYGCELCNFDVHPLCTQLPQQVQHFLHPPHPLTLRPFSSTWCLLCKNECTSWRYRCGICCVDIHLDCLSTSCDLLTSTSTPPSVLRLSAPPAATAPAFVANCAYNVPSFGTAPYAYCAQSPPVGAQSYAYPVPSASSPSNNYYQHPEGNQQQVDGARFRKKIYKLVGRLALGIVTNGVLGN